MNKFCMHCGAPLDENGRCTRCNAQMPIPPKPIEPEFEEHFEEAPQPPQYTPIEPEFEEQYEAPAPQQYTPIEPEISEQYAAPQPPQAPAYEPEFAEPTEGAPAAPAKPRKKIFTLPVKIVLSVICVLLIAFSACTALVYHKVLRIPPINALLEWMEIMEKEPERIDTPAPPVSDTPIGTPEDTPAGEELPPLSNFRSETFDIYINATVNVVFTVEVTDPAKVDTGKLNLHDESGKILGYMRDDGQNGDRTAGDQIYSAETTVSSAEVKRIGYYASDGTQKSNQFKLNFYSDIPSESLTAAQTLFAAVDALDYTGALNLISTSAEVVSYEANEAAGTITYKTVYGITAIYQDPAKVTPGFKASGSHALPKDETITQENYIEAERIIDSLSFTSMIHDRDVAVLRPFRGSEFTYDDFLYAGEQIANATNGSLRTFDDGNADIDTFKSLDDYGVILIDSHGSNHNNTPYILTGESFNIFKNYSADFRSDRIVVISGRLSVNGEFFDRYYTAETLNTSYWFLGTCYSMMDQSIANALIREGAGAVTGFTQPVSVGYCNRILFESVLNSMVLSTDSVKNSVESARDYYGEADPQSTDCEYVFDGNSSYVLFAGNENVTSAKRDIILVLDRSGSMSGTPIRETKIAATSFVETILGQEASIGLVTYDSESQLVSYTTNNEYALTNAIQGIPTGGTTNIEAGLRTAREMLEDSQAEKKIIVLMSDGLPNEGREGDSLIEYANTIKDEDITIFTLGFFESLSSDRYDAQRLMEGIASDGCHYEVEDANNLRFFFEDIADTINGQRYYYIRIACPVDVTITYNGETLSSNADTLSTRTSFGTLSFEENENAEGEEDSKIKILRLKEGADYEITINGTGEGTMDYTVSYMDQDGKYTDQRFFEDIEINEKTKITTIVAPLSASTLKVDEDGDGDVDLVYRAEKNGNGRLIDVSGKLRTIYIIGIVALLVQVIIIVSGIRNLKKRKQEKLLAAAE